MNKISLQKRHWWAILVLVMAIAIGGRAYSIYSKNAATAAKTSGKTAVVIETATAARGAIAASLSASGTVQGIQEANIAAKAAGRIQSTPVVDGSFVTAGQLLVDLDASEVRAQLGQALASKAQTIANRENSRAFLGRLTELYKEDAVAKQQLDNAQTQYNVYDAQVAQSNATINLYQAQLSNMTLVAPFSGQIANKRIVTGDMAAPNQLLMTLVDTSKVKVEITLGETDIGKIKIGQTAAFKVDAFPNETFTAAVSEISPAADLKSRTFKVWLLSDNPGIKLRSGLFARVAIDYAQNEQALRVPKDAVLLRDKQKYVFVIADDTAKLVPVTTGLENNKEVEIISGLDAGAVVSVWGHENLNNGDKVSVQKRGDK
ncbi:MAG: efflux RND transporter periplasmic adaptor subunit [Negativicutes bacterium]